MEYSSTASIDNLISRAVESLKNTADLCEAVSKVSFKDGADISSAFEKTVESFGGFASRLAQNVGKASAAGLVPLGVMTFEDKSAGPFKAMNAMFLSNGGYELRVLASGVYFEGDFRDVVMTFSLDADGDFVSASTSGTWGKVSRDPGVPGGFGFGIEHAAAIVPVLCEYMAAQTPEAADVLVSNYLKGYIKQNEAKTDRVLSQLQTVNSMSGAHLEEDLGAERG